MGVEIGLGGLPVDAKKFLELILLPSPVLEEGTPYEKKETPHCHQDSEQNSLVVVFSDESRNSSWMGDEDNYHRSSWYELPNKIIVDLLDNIRPGGRRMCAVGRVNVFEEDSAFGYDCEEPHDNKSHRKVEIVLFAELSEDQRTAILEIHKSFIGGQPKQMHVSLSRAATE